MTQEQMAHAAKIPVHTYKKYELDKITPGGDALASLARLGINVTWLLTGDGEMMAANAGTAGALTAEQQRAGYVYLPLYDVRAKAGEGGGLVENERVVKVLAFEEEWIRRELRVRPGDLRLIYVEGDSMEPELRPGDIMLIDHTDTTARREGVYVVRMDGALLVKQLQRLPGGIIKVISRNRAYEPFIVKTLEAEQGNGFAIVGRVVWACRRQ